MSTLPEERRVELEGRFHRALLALRDAGVIEKILDDRWTLEEEAATQLAIDYFHAGVPCPFLEDESCSIHPMRPLSCREYLVTSPPELCQDPSANQVAGVRLPLKLSRVLYAFGQQLSQDRRGWIPLVFLLAWKKGDQRPGDYVAGTGEEVLKKFLEQVAAMPPHRKWPAGRDASWPIATRWMRFRVSLPYLRSLASPNRRRFLQRTLHRRW